MFASNIYTLARFAQSIKTYFAALIQAWQRREF
jgi:hypothetical protein